VKAPKLVPLSHVGDDLAKVNLAAPVAVATCLWVAADVANTQARTDLSQDVFRIQMGKGFAP